ncbi:MAG: M90 family metallopeptidase [Bacteroidota bacterium]
MILKTILIVSIGIYLVYRVAKGAKQWQQPLKAFPESWRKILLQKVSYYQNLSEEKRVRFEFKVQEFLLNCQITGVETEVSLTDRLLVAASAVIPIFAFPKWQYRNLDEVLIYPRMFNADFETQGKGRHILGMVGNGYMDRKMILSKQALHMGFQNETDKRNTAIHEFIHLIDQMDGHIDGIPKALMEKQYVIPWVDMIEQKIEAAVAQKSDIHPYAQTSRVEFFAVISEYLFERPHLLKKKHPDLYAILEEIFNQDLASN